MISLRQLLNDMEDTIQEKEASMEKKISLDDLKHTAQTLEKLSAPDREVDFMAKLAVLHDMGLPKIAGFWNLKPNKMKAVRQAHYAAKDANTIAKIKQETQKIIKETDRIEHGKQLSDYKAPILAVAASGATGYLAYNKGKEDKKAELQGLAQKYYSAGGKK